MTKTCRTLFSAAALLMLGAALAACGKRAAFVDPPPGVAKDQFPHVYPDPSTDPSNDSGPSE
mgnify:CR=1 FL=1